MLFFFFTFDGHPLGHTLTQPRRGQLRGRAEHNRRAEELLNFPAAAAAAAAALRPATIARPHYCLGKHETLAHTNDRFP